MVSIISRWLQKKMPSYGEVESKVTKEQIEDNKDVSSSIKLHVFWLIFTLLFYVFTVYEKIYLVSYLALLAVIMDVVFLVLSLIISSKIKILKFKISMFFLLFSGVFGYIMLLGMSLFMLNDLKLDIIVIIINIIAVYFIFFKNAIKTTKYQIFIKFGCVFAVISSIWEIFFGEGMKEGFIEAVFCVILFNIIFKLVLNCFSTYFKTLFYVLAYPEEFRRKFGYSVKEWYGNHSPQYRDERKLNQ